MGIKLAIKDNNALSVRSPNAIKDKLTYLSRLWVQDVPSHSAKLRNFPHFQNKNKHLVT